MKTCILNIITFFFSISAHAQFPRPQVSTQSPNATGISVYGDVPVSHYTGIPQISIPLYTLEEGKISVPISLSYHAAGVRPNQHPGWVGMGWSLSAGGAITRKVRSIPDDIAKVNRVGLFANSVMLNPTDMNWETTAYIDTLSKKLFSDLVDTEPDEFSFNFLGFSGSFYIDGENHTLKVRSEHQFKITPIDNTTLCPPTKERNYNAQNATLYCTDAPNATPHPEYTKGFILTDVNGTQYVFGGDLSSIEYSINFFNQYNNIWIANAWYLKKIVTLEGRSVTFNYDNGDPTDGFPYLANLSLSYYVEEVQIDGGPIARNLLQLLTGFIIRPNLNPSCSSWASISNPFVYGGDLVWPVYLKDITITTPNSTNTHKIEFEKSISNELKYPDRVFNEFLTYRQNAHVANPNNSDPYLSSDLLPYLKTSNTEETSGILNYTNRLKWYKLNAFKVYNQRNELINEYNFNYNDVPTERLFLNSVRKKETGASAYQTHSFTYFDKGLLPSYFDESDKTDHWGFLNGGVGSDVRPLIGNRDAPQLLIKKQPTQSAIMAKAGTLSSITYPTGGTTSFDYELNSYSKIVSPKRSTFVSGTTIGTTGGIRVKAITSCESENNCIKKEYFYVSGYLANSDPLTLTSSGILAGEHQYASRNDYEFREHDNDHAFQVRSVAFSCSSLLPGSENSYGSHIGYSEVVEKHSGNTPTSNNGYTIYKFTNFGTDNGQHMDEDVPDGSRFNISDTRTIFEPFIDKSYERGKLTSQRVYTSSGALVNSRNIEYSIVNPSIIRAIKVNTSFICGTYNVLRSGIAYKIYKSFYLPSRETSVQYGNDGNPAYGSITTETNYEYNILGFERIKKVKQSDGSELITRKVYVGDLALNDTQLMANANSYCTASPRPPEYTSCYNLCLQNGGEIPTCRYDCNNQCIDNYVNARITKPDAIDLKQMYNANMIAPVIEQQTWKLDAGGAQTLLSGGINFYKKYSTGYQVNKSNVLPLRPDISDVNVLNRNYISFPYSNIDNDYNFNYYGKYSTLSPVVKFDDTYGYDSKGNIVQFTGRDGVPTTYIWGYQNMYPVATIVGATYQEVITAMGYSPNENTNFQSKLKKEDILPLLQTLRTNLNTSKPIAQVTTRTYKSGVGIDSETSPNGLVTTYEYDTFNRLKEVLNHEGNVVKSYKYNYKNQ